MAIFFDPRTGQYVQVTPGGQKTNLKMQTTPSSSGLKMSGPASVLPSQAPSVPPKTDYFQDNPVQTTSGPIPGYVDGYFPMYNDYLSPESGCPAGYYRPTANSACTPLPFGP